MKSRNRHDIAIVLIFAGLTCFLVVRWAWKAAYRGGFPFFSMATFEAVWPWVALLVICLIGTSLRDQDSE